MVDIITLVSKLVNVVWSKGKSHCFLSDMES